MAPFPSPTSKWHDNTYDTLSPSRPELSVKGQNILITGGGSGIGAETARYFARAGASRIALLGRREQPLLETKASIEQLAPGIEVFTASTDVTQKSEVDAAFAKFAEGGKINVLISGAALTGPTDPISEVDSEKFMHAVNFNLTGALNTAQAFLRHAAPDAVVVEINSSAMHVNFGPGFAAYAVAKFAVFRLWDSVGNANPGLRVYHIQPGVVDTDMNKEAGGVAAVGHEDHVSLPASFMLWLASSEAAFLKNKFLWTNWDVDELKAQAKEIEAGTKFNVGLVGWPFEGGEWKFQATESAAGHWN